MRGDFSRFTFNPWHNYLAVLRQQGRVELDSDWNEQADLAAEYLRQLAADIFGPLGIPLNPNDITNDNSLALAVSAFSSESGDIIDFRISRGVAYIGGYIYRLPLDVTFRTQIDYPEPVMPDRQSDLLVYLEAWKRSISYIDDESIREPALGGPDTCLRSKLLGQVRVLTADDLNTPDDACRILADAFPPNNIGLTMRIDQSSHQLPLNFGEVDLGGGLIPGNLHYRLEIHRGINDTGDTVDGFKWSDENSAVATRALKALSRREILAEESEQVTGESFKPGDWVEIGNIITELHRQGSQMARISSLESVTGGLMIKLDCDIHPLLTRRKNSKSTLEPGLAPRIRRWSGFYTPMSLKDLYDLGRGVKALFTAGDRKYYYEPGDYWTFAIRDREYNKRLAPSKTLPDGIKKYRHPLAIIKRGARSEKIIDCRRFFKPAAAFKSE
jgi:hypothetical protein